MKRFVKALLLALGGLFVALLVAGLWFALTFDPNAYRDRIAALVQETTGRELAIDGDLGVRLFPRLAVEVGAMRLAQPGGFGEPAFASVAHVDADVRLLPLLLRRDVEVGRLRLEGLTVELRRHADGATNWADIGPQFLRASRQARGVDPETGAGASAGRFRIGAAEIEHTTVRYVDEQTGREIVLGDASLRTGGVAPGEPFAIEMRFALAAGALSADVQGRGELVIAAGRLELREAAVDVGLENAPLGALDVRIATPAARYEGAELRVERPRVEIKNAGGSHILIEGSFEAEALAFTGGDALAVTAPALDLALEGDQVPGGRTRLKARSPALEASIAGQTLRMEDMVGEAYGLTMHASAAGAQLGDAPVFTGRVELAPFSPRELLEKFGRAPAATTDPQALTRAALDARYTLSASGLELADMHLQLDDTAIAGELAVTDFLRGAMRVDLDADRIDLDRYLAPPGAATGPHAFALTSESLRALDIAGSVQIAELRLAGLRSTDVRLRAN